MASTWKGCFVLLVCATFVFAQPKEDVKHRTDSLKAMLKLEAEKYPLEPNELFTEAPGLKGLTDSAFNSPDQNNAIKQYSPRLRYPLLINQKVLGERLAKNRDFLAKLKAASKNKSQVVPDSTEGYLHFRLFDDVIVTAVCDRIEKTLQGDVWEGHLKEDKMSVARILFDKQGGVGMIELRMNSRPIYMYTAFGDAGAFLLREQTLLPESRPD